MSSYGLAMMTMYWDRYLFFLRNFQRMSVIGFARQAEFSFFIPALSVM